MSGKLVFGYITGQLMSGKLVFWLLYWSINEWQTGILVALLLGQTR